MPAQLLALLLLALAGVVAGRKGRSVKLDGDVIRAQRLGGDEVDGSRGVVPAIDRGAWERAMGAAGASTTTSGFGDDATGSGSGGISQLGAGGGAVNGDVKYLWDEATDVFTQERFEEAEELWLNIAELVRPPRIFSHSMSSCDFASDWLQVPPATVDAATNYAHCFRRQKRYHEVTPPQHTTHTHTHTQAVMSREGRARE